MPESAHQLTDACKAQAAYASIYCLIHVYHMEHALQTAQCTKPTYGNSHLQATPYCVKVSHNRKITVTNVNGALLTFQGQGPSQCASCTRLEW